MAKYKGTGGASVPLTLDGTGLTTDVPLTVLNGKDESGVVVKVTGGLASGYVLQSSAGTVRGAFGVCAAADDWMTGTVLEDAVVAYSSGQKLRIGVLGAAASTMVLGAGKVGINQPAATSPDVEIAIGKALTNVLGGSNPMIQVGVDVAGGVLAGGFAVGQSAGNNVLTWWRGNATASSAVAVIETSGWNNQIVVNASSIALQGESYAHSNVLIGTKTDDKGAKLTILKTSAITSGEARSIHSTGTFNPTSGTATYQHLGLAYTINQTGGASGNTCGILMEATETALGGTHTLIDLKVGGTTKFRVDNAGTITTGLAAIALGGGAAPTVGTIGGSGPATAAQASWMKINIAGADHFIPLWT